MIVKSVGEKTLNLCLKEWALCCDLLSICLFLDLFKCHPYVLGLWVVAHGVCGSSVPSLRGHCDAALPLQHSKALISVSYRVGLFQASVPHSIGVAITHVS